MTPSAWVEAAQLARKNAHECRRLATLWRYVKPQWAEQWAGQAARAYERAHWYLATARMYQR